jgi:hypothetical protein
MAIAGRGIVRLRTSMMSLEEEPSEKLNSLTDGPKTGAERQAKVDAKKRDEKIAKGEQADKPPLRPSDLRRRQLGDGRATGLEVSLHEDCPSALTEELLIANLGSGQPSLGTAAHPARQRTEG